MPKRWVKRPTDAELTILKVLWDRGPSTVRQVHRTLNDTKPRSYTTTLKQMQVMRAKGLLVRDESRRPQVYRPAAPQGRTQRQLVEHLLERAFGGSARRLVLQALRARDFSKAELARVERLLDELEGDDR